MRKSKRLTRQQDRKLRKMKKQKNKLQAIYNKYCDINYNEGNYFVGGGLAGGKFASRRHEDAKEDEGKLTLGEATKIFKTATGLETKAVKKVLKSAVQDMEYHHAGSYGGGMKKTYFLNAKEICECAKNWDENVELFNVSNEAEKEEAELEKKLENKKLEFLKNNAKKIERVTTKPDFFYQTAQEMDGRYGWFDSTYKSYNLTEYFSGWQFTSEELYKEFLNIK